MKPAPCNHVVARIADSSFSVSEFIYYTGKDPLEELEPIARHVTGVCANETGFTEGNKGNEGRSRVRSPAYRRGSASSVPSIATHRALRVHYPSSVKSVCQRQCLSVSIVQ